ncbi:SDR family NAD(P)-dependent oxidoreductase [Erythrobacteraceae bacterium CFH 75059]|uniref:SDR family NAD(P)-dependent oxidoreductase n=1 Tax=Qipengyuania thermophila TaxID=2509361 RepID=UPI0010228C24|nr:SDR family NAD(P)-dependent oxidoreductase [Qipengyuania thermophila]TCD05151.1 SDR family NAD(P)-dependent oxidoreductase [Erythrobacteraceae bacterium CFH 75059]
MPKVSRRSLLAGAAAAGSLATAHAAFAGAPWSEGQPDLKGTSILITGCSSGFGRLGAEHYARLGAKVFATMRGLPRPEADTLRALAARDGLDITVLDLDVTSDEQVAAAVAEAERLAGGALDVLVNNAGIGISGPVEVQDMEATKLAFDTNVYGCHRLARAVLPAMRARRRGLIIPISSQLGRVIAPFSGHYSATKFALEAMSEALAYEVAMHGIEVAIVQPGGYPTDVWRNRNRYTGALRERIEPRHADGYWQVVERMGTEDGSGRTADPMDVPRAIASIIAMPAGSRPLRTPVSAGTVPQTAINEVSARIQVEWLGGSPAIGPAIRAVHGV